jgi:ribose/xylose/arabinose/galactoside ABC-type transport system permease subunit
MAARRLICYEAALAKVSVMQPQAFASTENFYNITRNFVFIGIMALGMTAVIVTGGIDLSVGSVSSVLTLTDHAELGRIPRGDEVRIRRATTRAER